VAQSGTIKPEIAPTAEKQGLKRTTLVLLMAGAFIIFLLGLAIGGVEFWVLSHKDSENGDQAKVQPATQGKVQPATQGNTGNTAAAADSGNNALNQEVSHASPDERQPIAEALALAEEKYANDYRFPFEHAKLTVSGNAHHHAFGLLYIAGQRAINAGEADRLLSDLEKHKSLEFVRCSKGHEEWDRLENALKSKDKSSLDNALATMHRDIVGGADDMVMKY
jgi:hypothetical protein